MLDLYAWSIQYPLVVTAITVVMMIMLFHMFYIEDRENDSNMPGSFLLAMLAGRFWIVTFPIITTIYVIWRFKRGHTLEDTTDLEGWSPRGYQAGSSGSD